MYCERCHKQPATVHMQQFVNGQKAEIHLCTDCASQLDMHFSFDNFFQGFLDSFFNTQLKSVADEASQIRMVKCDTCGLTYEGFKNTGRLGCADCYHTFRNELNSILKNVQGSNQHQGKFPKKAGAELLNKRHIQNLKVQLTKAIEAEEYETAAKLRDEIRELEGGV